MGVYLWTDEWLPGSNTIAYYPLETDANDYSGNGYNMNNNGVVFGSYNGVQCGYFNNPNSSSTKYLYKSGSLFTGNPTFTVSIWGKYIGTDFSNYWSFGTELSVYSFCLFAGQYDNSTRINIGGWSNDHSKLVNLDNNWHNIIFAYSQGNGSVYFDGSKIHTGTRSPDIGNNNTSIGKNARPESATTDQKDCFHGYLSQCIFEKIKWNDQNALGYYNQTKSNYGL